MVVVVVVVSPVVLEEEEELPSNEAMLESSAEATESSPEMDVEVVDSGNIEGQIAAPMAPIAIPTGKAMASSCLVSFWRLSLMFVAAVGTIRINHRTILSYFKN